MRATRVGITLGVSAMLIVTGAGASSADNRDLLETKGAVKAGLMQAMDLTGSPACWSISLAKSNHRWALVSPTDKCGANSGHTVVYKKVGQRWKYLFYDMQNDGCVVFKVPDSVRKDFAPYVC